MLPRTAEFDGTSISRRDRSDRTSRKLETLTEQEHERDDLPRPLLARPHRAFVHRSLTGTLSARPYDSQRPNDTPFWRRSMHRTLAVALIAISLVACQT